MFGEGGNMDPHLCKLPKSRAGRKASSRIVLDLDEGTTIALLKQSR
jgi:hypothetical protein